MSDQRVIFIVFAGRRENMVVARPFFDRFLSDYPSAELHLWNLTRNAPDDKFVRAQHDPEARVHVWNELWPGENDWPKGVCRKKLRRPRSCGCWSCRPAPYEEVYHWYAEHPEYADAVLVKTDDDVLFFQTGTFHHVLEELTEHPNAVLSACVVNNVVSAKHSPRLRKQVEARFGPTTQREWFDLHADADFAVLCHNLFLSGDLLTLGHDDLTKRDVVRCLPGEKPSINFIAFTYPTLLRMSAAMRHNAFRKIGDEGTVDSNFLPRIVRSFVVAHLQFGPQRVGLPDEVWDGYRDRYAQLGKEYLG